VHAIRFLILADLPRVVEIERATCSDPWSIDDFDRAFRRLRYIGIVAEFSGSVAGFAVFRGDAPLQVENVAVAPSLRRQGIGRALLEWIQSQRRDIIADVSERNLIAQLFLRSCGFRAMRVIRDFYRDGADAYQFEFHRGGATARTPITECAAN